MQLEKINVLEKKLMDLQASFEQKYGIWNIANFVDSKLQVNQKWVGEYRDIIRNPRRDVPIGEIPLIDLFCDVHFTLVDAGLHAASALLDNDINQMKPALEAVYRAEVKRSRISKHSKASVDSRIEFLIGKIAEKLPNDDAFNQIISVLPNGKAATETQQTNDFFKLVNENYSNIKEAETSAQREITAHALRTYCRYSFNYFQRMLNAYKTLKTPPILQKPEITPPAEIHELLDELSILNYCNHSIEPRFGFKNFPGLFSYSLWKLCEKEVAIRGGVTPPLSPPNKREFKDYFINNVAEVTK